MMELVIDSIRVSLLNHQRVVILKQKEIDRYLPIWIGPPEADAIAVRLQEVSVPRPLTHDLLHNSIKDLGGVIDHIVVSSMENDTYYATIVVNQGDKTVEIDARPSDALALAVRAKVQIFAAPEVMEKCGVRLDKDGETAFVGEDEMPAPAREGGGPVGEEEAEKLSAFADFIESLDLGDMDSPSSGEDQPGGGKPGGDEPVAGG
ncbi:bifunctional nuclease family protein [Candidatus Lucifugimonas marina]|uniref:Bifunctional nuclease family protein n=2 Tax=Candidatus Lucifugimonas marina TaxID=3038979 RepID=A0AAJ5ZLF3_9CHLR|nr:bifunctional nuclease family protein [SAR202 cluster bacterium JH702]MDG0870488.1 bifunctional nuclease family protein [SAR202 cluster bacterium JH639]WFG36847.1 bifunctional nuclease family protein [SAR202 cluster bacterium JH545]WFG40786.1 bifunctional nuclease family protein [SAR202 cluster bacterium JH1073]